MRLDEVFRWFLRAGPRCSKFVVVVLLEVVGRSSGLWSGIERTGPLFLRLHNVRAHRHEASVAMVVSLKCPLCATSHEGCSVYARS